MGCASSTEVAASSAPATSTPNKDVKGKTTVAAAANGTAAAKQPTSSSNESETMAVSNSHTGDENNIHNHINSIINNVINTISRCFWYRWWVVFC